MGGARRDELSANRQSITPDAADCPHQGVQSVRYIHGYSIVSEPFCDAPLASKFQRTGFASTDAFVLGWRGSKDRPGIYIQSMAPISELI